ncbi:MAG: metal ABC transporter permease [Syntrophobacterales bacterium]|nr:metal ABC transporter permease [Syntrophobacterales bacterium]
MIEWVGWLYSDFMGQAFLAAFLASIACGIIGALVVANRMVFLAGGIAHAAYGGVGLAIFLRVPILPVVTIFSILCALLLGLITFKRQHHADALVSALWSVGMALGVIFVNLTPGYQADLMGYLFGSILTVTRSDIFIMAILDGLLFMWIWLFYREVMAVSYDMEYAQVIGIPAFRIYYFILVFTAVAVILLMRFVGLILVLAMLSIPSYLSESWSGSLKRMMVLSSLFTFLFMVLGLLVSYELNLPAGPIMIVVAGVSFGLVECLKLFWRWRRSKNY